MSFFFPTLAFIQCPGFKTVMTTALLLRTFRFCRFSVLTLKDAAAFFTLALTSESLSQVANLSKLFCKLPVDHVRSKKGKADLYSDKGHQTMFELMVLYDPVPSLECQLFHYMLQLTDKTFQCTHLQFHPSSVHN